VGKGDYRGGERRYLVRRKPRIIAAETTDGMSVKRGLPGGLANPPTKNLWILRFPASTLPFMNGSQALEKRRVTVVLAEDQQLVRQGLRLLLEREPSFALIGEAADGWEAAQMTTRQQPDVLVLDLMLPRLHGLDVIRQVRENSPRTRILVLSMHADEPYVLESLSSGAAGYLLKDCSATELIKAIKTVQTGQSYLSPALAGRLNQSEKPEPAGRKTQVTDILTKRERSVLKLAAEGFNCTEIAATLSISPRTAETHRANLMRKLELRSQTELVRFAIRSRIISA
jgi:DNA-binding NarL/FixJ family response regulator